MYGQFMKYISNIDRFQLQMLVENDISLLKYEKTGLWIKKNVGWLSKIYRFINPNIDIDKLLQEGREHNEEVYHILNKPYGRIWLEKQFNLLKELLEGVS